MKRLKFVPYIVLAIVFGYFFGNVFFCDYKDNSLTAFSEGEKLFFVQLGVYETIDNIKNYLSFGRATSVSNVRIENGILKWVGDSASSRYLIKLDYFERQK